MDNLKVLICSVNSKYIHSSLAPWCLKAGIENYSFYNHKVLINEGTINESPEAVAARIINNTPDIVGFCCYIWNIDFVIQTAKLLREKLPTCVIVFGGPEVSYNPLEVLTKYDFVDYLISGEGEYPFAILCDRIFEQKPIEIDGVCFKTENSFKISNPYVSNSIPPSPYCDEYFKTLKGRISYIESTRGCPYSCAFCLSGRCGKVRNFDLQRTKNEIITLSQSGSKTIKFIDRTFNANKARAKEIIKFILENFGKSIPTDVCFHFEIAGDILDDELINLFSKAPKGIFQLEIGMQSFNEKTLEEINRKTNCEILKKNIKSLIKPRNIHIHIDLIAGLPLEDYNSFKQSFNTAYNLKADMLQLGFLKLLHGSPMRENLKKYPCDFNKAAPYEVIETPYISKYELDKLREIEEICERTYNSGRFLLTLEYIICCGYKPFEIFEKLTEDLKNIYKISLEEFTTKLYNSLLKFIGVDRKKLRDIMVCDLLSSIKNAKIPSILQVKDPFLRTAKHYINRKYPTNKNIQRGIALLYTEENFAFVDYTNRDKIMGRFTLNKIPFSKIEKLND